MFAMFFTCSSSFLFHGLALKMYYPVDVSVCVLAVLGGFKDVFLFRFFPSLLKENPLVFSSLVF